MQPTDQIVKDLFFAAHVLGVILLEAVLFVDQFPQKLAIVVGVGLYVGMHIEVLAPVIGFVFDVPDPTRLGLQALVFPHVLVLDVSVHFFGALPMFRDQSGFAPANGTTSALADSAHDPQLAIVVDVHSDDPEEFGLDEFFEERSGAVIETLEGVFVGGGELVEGPVAAEEEEDWQQYVPSFHH